MSEDVELEITGTDPVSHARRVLEQYEDESNVESVSIRLSIEEATAERRPTRRDSRGTRSPPSVSKEEVTDSRDKGNVRPNTSHHRVLHALREASDGDGVPAKEVQRQVTGVADSTVHPALTQLWERELVTRHRVDDVEHPYYAYELTEHGRQSLSDLGDPDDVLPSQ